MEFRNNNFWLRLFFNFFFQSFFLHFCVQCSFIQQNFAILQRKKHIKSSSDMHLIQRFIYSLSSDHWHENKITTTNRAITRAAWEVLRWALCQIRSSDVRCDVQCERTPNGCNKSKRVFSMKEVTLWNSRFSFPFSHNHWLDVWCTRSFCRSYIQINKQIKLCL